MCGCDSQCVCVCVRVFCCDRLNGDCHIIESAQGVKILLYRDHYDRSKTQEQHVRVCWWVFESAAVLDAVCVCAETECVG